MIEIKDSTSVRLGYRKPYRFDELLGFFSARVLSGVETVDEGSYSRTVRLVDGEGTHITGWLRVVDDLARSCLVVTLSDSLAPVLSQVIARIRHQFDCDSDPVFIAEGLASMGDAICGLPVAGTRLPGCFDPFETACRAVLGQQVTVKAANAIAGRIAQAYGAPIDTGIDGLERAWPTPDEVLSIPDLESAFGEQGVIKTRTNVIAQIASAIQSGELDLSPGVLVETQMEKLLSMKGVGPWTANYIAMRTMAYPDAFLESDSGVAHALPDLSPKERVALAESWRPWRSYAVINLWNSLTG